MKKKKANNFSAIGDILAQVLGDKKYRHKAKQYTLWECWDEVVGEQVAKQAQPVQMQGTTLVVRVKSSAWMQELQMMQPQLLSKIHAVVPAETITAIRLILR